MIQKVEISWRHREQEGAIPVEVVYSKRRTIGLEIKADGHVYARVPERIPNQYVMDFIKERQEWIVQKWFMIMERRRQEQSRPVKDYEKDPELEKLYRKKAKMQLENRCAYFAKRMAVDYNRIAEEAAVRPTLFMDTFTRSIGDIPLKGLYNIDAVQLAVWGGELAHRKEMNHSQRFWAEVERILPDYKARRKWLKEFGSQV